MATSELNCWKCGEALVDLLLPVPRLAKCKHCKADLHVCRLCEFYDTTVNNSCREPIAEKVSDKTRSNFCGYFQPTTLCHANKTAERGANAASLESLFGLDPGASGMSNSDAEKSKQELDRLFGLDDKKQD